MKKKKQITMTSGYEYILIEKKHHFSIFWLISSVVGKKQTVKIMSYIELLYSPRC